VSLEIEPFARLPTSSYSSPIVTTDISYIVSQIERDSDRKSYFSRTPLLHNNPLAKRLQIFSCFSLNQARCLAYQVRFCLLTAQARHR